MCIKAGWQLTYFVNDIGEGAAPFVSQVGWLHSKDVMLELFLHDSVLGQVLTQKASHAPLIYLDIALS
jgi:hypothetical protein